MKVHTKITVACVSLILFSTLVTQTIVFSFTSRQTMQSTVENSSNTAQLLSEFIDSRLRNTVRSTFNLMNSDIFNFNQSSYFVRYMLSGDPSYYAQAATEVSTELMNFRVSDDLVSTVYLHTSRGDFLDDTKTQLPTYQYEESTLYRLIKDGFREGIYWCDAQQEEMYRARLEIIPVVFAYKHSMSNETMYFVVNLNKAKILEYAQDLVRFESGNVFIYNLDTKKVLLNINSLFLDEFFADTAPMQTKTIGTQTYLVAEEKTDTYYLFQRASAFSPWTTVTVRAHSTLFSNLIQATRMTILVIVISIVVCVLVAIRLARSITRPLHHLEKTMLTVSDRNFDINFTYNKRDEIGSLGQKFNFMIAEIKRLILQLSDSIRTLEIEKERVKDEQIKKRKAELAALQAQINPHFLYNTLNSIVWMAERNGAHEISSLTKALGSFFELSLNDGKRWLTLREELLQAESYLRIQKIRYGEKLAYEVICEPGIEDLMCIKLLLQPLVENAIYHGVKEVDRMGHVRVYAGRHKNEADLVLTVTDNGPGMPFEQMEILNQQLLDSKRPDSSGYGIFNVNERIHLACGEDYGLRYYNNTQGGTIAEIILPILRAEEVLEDV